MCIHLYHSVIYPPKIISLVVVVGLVWSHDPKSYTGGSFSFWQVLPSQAGQRVGFRQIDDRIAGSRARVVLTGRYNLCILAESYCCSGENTAIVGRCCVHQLSNQQPKKNFRGDSTSEWVSECNLSIVIHFYYSYCWHCTIIFIICMWFLYLPTFFVYLALIRL